MNEKRMKDALETIARRNIPENVNLWPNISTRLERKSLMMRLRVRPILAMLIALLILLVLSGVAFAIGNMLGYLPGFGMVDQYSSVRMLSQPVSQTREGITVTVKEVVVGPDKTVVVYSEAGVQRSMLPTSENVSGCHAFPVIRLPDGKILNSTDGGGSTSGFRLEYDAIPSEINAVTFFIPCIFDTLPDKAPKEWELTLHFVPAPADLAIMPIVEISPSPEIVETEPSNALYGISLKLDKFIPLPDGYYLIGHTEWVSDSIIEAGPAAWGMKAYDASGRELPLAPAIYVEDTAIRESIGPGHWIYHLYSKNFNGSVTLRTKDISVHFKEPVQITLDLRPYGFTFLEDQLGQTWSLGSQPLALPNITATVEDVTYIKIGEQFGFDFTIHADQSLQNIGFAFESGLDTTGLSMVSGSNGGTSRDATTGMLHASATTNAKMMFPLVLSAGGAGISGNWEVTWEPADVDVNATPAYMPLPCVTLDKWKQAIAEPVAIPPDLLENNVDLINSISPDGQWMAYSEKVLGRMTPGIYLSKLDGSEPRLIVQLDYWMSAVSHWSQDSKWLVFTVANMDQYSSPTSKGIVNVETCEFYPLP